MDMNDGNHVNVGKEMIYILAFMLGFTAGLCTTAQMQTWYSKLHTDSSEYKMWGNGIALPCALYVMQGIKEDFIHDGMEAKEE